MFGISEDKIFTAVLGIAGWFFTTSLAKFSTIKNNWEKLQMENILIKQSLKRAWQEIDKLKTTPK